MAQELFHMVQYHKTTIACTDKPLQFKLTDAFSDIMYVYGSQSKVRGQLHLPVQHVVSYTNEVLFHSLIIPIQLSVQSREGAGWEGGYIGLQLLICMNTMKNTMPIAFFLYKSSFYSMIE